MSITAQVKIDPYPSSFPIWGQRDTKALLERAVAIIRARTKKGVDIHGKRFRPYDEDYAEDEGPKVDLKVTGKMLDTLKVTALEASGTITSPTDYAKYVNATREFLGLTDKEAQTLVKWAEDRISANLKAAGV